MLVRLISPWMIQSSQGNGSIDGLFNDTHCSKEHRPKLTNGGMIRYLPHCSGNGFYIYLQMNRIWIAFYSVGPLFFSSLLPSSAPQNILHLPGPFHLCFAIFNLRLPLGISELPLYFLSFIIFTCQTTSNFVYLSRNHFCLIFNCPSHNRHSFILQLKISVTLPKILSSFTYYFWSLSWPLICHYFSPFSAPRMLVFLCSSAVIPIHIFQQPPRFNIRSLLYPNYLHTLSMCTYNGHVTNVIH